MPTPTSKYHPNYTPFGSSLNTRSFSAGSGFRFGFNGKENFDKYQDYGFRIYYPELGKFLSTDPLIVFQQKYPELSSFQFASNMPICAIDLDGLEAYYTADGKFLEWRGIKGDNSPVVLVTYTTVNKKVTEYHETLIIEGKNIRHIEFEQTAAYAYNETYPNNKLDKFRVANTIVNSFYFYHNLSKGDFQKALNIQRYVKGDSHNDRLNNISKISGTETKNYRKYFDKTEIERNTDKAMIDANAAALNALRKNGIDYTESIDGKKATNWLGENKTSNKNNRFYWRKNPHTAKLNRIMKFKNPKIIE